MILVEPRYRNVFSLDLAFCSKDTRSEHVSLLFSYFISLSPVLSQRHVRKRFVRMRLIFGCTPTLPTLPTKARGTPYLLLNIHFDFNNSVEKQT